MKEICSEKIFGSNGAEYAKKLISDVPMPNKKRILDYLKRGKAIAVAAGRARDMFTGEQIKGELLHLSDGEFGWRSDVIYYFDKYNLQLSEEFVEHVLKA